MSADLSDVQIRQINYTNKLLRHVLNEQRRCAREDDTAITIF
jgi:hypothetical protein